MPMVPEQPLMQERDTMFQAHRPTLQRPVEKNHPGEKCLHLLRLIQLQGAAKDQGGELFRICRPRASNQAVKKRPNLSTIN